MSTTKKAISNDRTPQQSRRLIVLLIAVALVSINQGPNPIAATSTGTVALQTATVPMLAGTTQALNAGAGEQLNSHVDCGLAAYSSLDSQGTSQIRYFDFAAGTDHLVPDSGKESLFDVYGGRIASTQNTASGQQVVIFDTATQTRTVVPGFGNIRPTLGGNIVAFDSAGYFNNLSESEIGIYDLGTRAVTWLTDDGLYDRSAAVSPNGNAVVWEKCQNDGFNCDVYAATQTAPGVFTTVALTGAAGDELASVTNGKIAVYTSSRGGETDIYFQPVGGGAETQLFIPGHQRNPSISGDLISFESEIVVGQTAEYDIFVYDISSGTLYQATNTPGIEMWSDIAVCNGAAHIVYTAQGADFDVYAFTFLAPNSPAAQTDDLIELVESFNPPGGTGNSLTTKLQDALAAIAVADTATACDSLTAFIKQCQAQSGKKLTAQQASQLINSANQIKGDLGCQ